MNKIVVEVVPRFGFHDKANAYITPHYAVHNGRYKLPLKDHPHVFKIGDKHYESASEPKAIKAKKGNPKTIYDRIEKAYGINAELMLAWVYGTWIATECYKNIGHFPFFSIFGKHGTGKSCLVSAMSFIRGIDIEGITLDKAIVTNKGFTRVAANLKDTHLCLIENNDKSNSTLSENSLLPWYNGQNVLLRAKFSNNNETHQEVFRSPVLFAQNYETFGIEALKSRIVSTLQTKDNFAKTEKAYQAFSNISKGQFARLGIELMKARKDILEKVFKNILTCKKRFLKEGVEPRIADTHAIILALHETVFVNHFKWSSTDLFPTLLNMAKLKEESSSQSSSFHFTTFIEILQECSINPENGCIALNGNQIGKVVKTKSDGKTIAISFSLLCQCDFFSKMIKQPEAFREGLTHTSHFIKASSAKIGIGANSSSKKCLFFEGRILELIKSKKKKDPKKEAEAIEKDDIDLDDLNLAHLTG